MASKTRKPAARAKVATKLATKAKAQTKAKPAAAKVKAAKVAKAKPAAKVATAKKKAGGGHGDGSRDRPWRLTTPSGQSEFLAYRDESADPPALVVVVGKTELRYHLRCLDDLRQMLRAHGDWMPLGSADEQKPAAPGTVEAWARAQDNPVAGWYGLKKGLRGRFANYVPPVMKQLALAEVENNPRHNRMRVI